MKGIDFWAQKALALIKRKVELQESLAAVEAEAGAAMLDAEEPDSSATSASFDRLERARAEIRALAVAITTCRARRLDAIRAARAAEAAALREGVAERSKALTSLETKASRLREQLAELEGCDYAPTGTPKSSALRAEIGELQRRALDIERSEIPVAGAVDMENVTTVDEVLLAVAVYPAVVPSTEEVLVWLAACEASAAKRGGRFEAHPRQVHLVWDADGINKQSHIFVRDLAEKRGVEEGIQYYDIASGTFRADVPTLASRPTQAPTEAQARSGWYSA